MRVGPAVAVATRPRIPGRGGARLPRGSGLLAGTGPQTDVRVAGNGRAAPNPWSPSAGGHRRAGGGVPPQDDAGIVRRWGQRRGSGCFCGGPAYTPPAACPGVWRGGRLPAAYGGSSPTIISGLPGMIGESRRHYRIPSSTAFLMQARRLFVPILLRIASRCSSTVLIEIDSVRAISL